jgi:hypothetical protein
VGERAEVIDRPGLRWSGGAPVPVVLADEYTCLFAFYGVDFYDDGQVCLAEIRRCLSVRFGFPNTDVLHAHPLGSALQYCRAHEVLDSRWLAEVRHNEAAHPHADKPVPYPWARHFFLTFHDSCLEALGEDIVVRDEHYFSIKDALTVMASEVVGPRTGFWPPPGTSYEG